MKKWIKDIYILLSKYKVDTDAIKVYGTEDNMMILITSRHNKKCIDGIQDFLNTIGKN